MSDMFVPFHMYIALIKSISINNIVSVASAHFFNVIKDKILTKMFSDFMRKFWNKLQLEGMVTLSMLFQFMLAVLGSQRKNFQGRASPYVRILVWLTYLLADWVATLALSTLMKSEKKELNSDLVVFWTPFLLLHLGGPDSITAYSLADNDLWLRHLLGLVIQVGAAVYVYVRFRTRYILTFMAIPIFIAGVIKYGERIWVLRSASSKQFSNSVFSTPSRGQDMPESSGSVIPYSQLEKLEEFIGRRSQSTIQEGGYLHQVYKSFRMFIPLFSDLRLRIYRDLKNVFTIPSMKFEDAFKLVDTELTFLYEVLYTKTSLLQSTVGIILRCVCLLATISALIAFSLVVGKRGYPPEDIAITYMLLAGAIFMDTFSVVAHVFSDWAMFRFAASNHWLISKSALAFVRAIASRIILNNAAKKGIETMAQHSLLNYCLKTKERKLAAFVRIFDTEDVLGTFWWTTSKNVSLDLKEFIHTQLINRYKRYEDSKFGYECLSNLLDKRGVNVLENKENTGMFDMRWSIGDVEFSHSLLLWHIATDIVYHDDLGRYPEVALGSHCERSKLLSDYMMYILIGRSQMLPKGISDVRVQDTRAELLAFIPTDMEISSEMAANALLHIDYESSLFFRAMSRSKSKSVLLEGCKLANQLSLLVEEARWDHEKKWEAIAQVWMEMLVFAASSCEWKEHAKHLRHGGELLTHVALLMAHLGLTKQIRIIEIPQYLQSVNYKPTWTWDWDGKNGLAYYLA